MTAWLDARADSTEALEELVATDRPGGRRAGPGDDGTGLEVLAESVTAAVAFDPGLAVGSPATWAVASVARSARSR